MELVRRFHGNLEPEYLVTNRGDLLAENRRLREVLEVPCKAVLNLPWMYESYRLAAQKDCGILLSGQYGNITISYGDFRSLFLTLLHQGRIKELVREINVYSRKYRRSKRSGGIFSRRKPVGIMKRCPGICMTKVPCGDRRI